MNYLFYMHPHVLHGGKTLIVAYARSTLSPADINHDRKNDLRCAGVRNRNAESRLTR